MKNKILKTEQLSENTFHIIFSNPDIAKTRKPGQFIILRTDTKGERIPLTIAGSNPSKGTVELYFQVVGKTTKKLSKLKKNEFIKDVSGPLGEATKIEKLGTVLCVAGGVGTAIVYPVADAYKKAGNKLVTIEGARTKSLLILEKELKNISDEFYPTTDDGSYGEKGLVTDTMTRLITDEQYNFDLVYVCGPIPMMNAVSELTKKYNIKTLVSLNPIMIDGTGMCGCCRVTINNETKFACVDGPDFDAHTVNFKELSMRLKTYHKQEKQDCGDSCKGTVDK